MGHFNDDYDSLTVSIKRHTIIFVWIVPHLKDIICYPYENRSIETQYYIVELSVLLMDEIFSALPIDGSHITVYVSQLQIQLQLTLIFQFVRVAIARPSNGETFKIFEVLFIYNQKLIHDPTFRAIEYRVNENVGNESKYVLQECIIHIANYYGNVTNVESDKINITLLSSATKDNYNGNNGSNGNDCCGGGNINSDLNSDDSDNYNDNENKSMSDDQSLQIIFDFIRNMTSHPLEKVFV